MFASEVTSMSTGGAMSAVTRRCFQLHCHTVQTALDLVDTLALLHEASECFRNALH